MFWQDLDNADTAERSHLPALLGLEVSRGREDEEGKDLTPRSQIWPVFTVKSNK